MLWQLLWPGWDQIWPNIVADVIFGAPAFIGQHLALRCHHRRTLEQHMEALRRSQAETAKKQAEGLGVLVGEALDAAHDRLVAAVAELPNRKRRSGW